MKTRVNVILAVTLLTALAAGTVGCKNSEAPIQAAPVASTQDQIKAIQNDSHMPAAVKAQAIARIQQQQVVGPQSKPK